MKRTSGSNRPTSIMMPKYMIANMSSAAVGARSADRLDDHVAEPETGARRTGRRWWARGSGRPSGVSRLVMIRAMKVRIMANPRMTSTPTPSSSMVPASSRRQRRPRPGGSWRASAHWPRVIARSSAYLRIVRQVRMSVHPHPRDRATATRDRSRRASAALRHPGAPAAARRRWSPSSPICAGVFVLLGSQQLRARGRGDGARDRPHRRRGPGCARRRGRVLSADPGTPRAAELADGPLQTAGRGGARAHRRAVRRDHRRPGHPARPPDADAARRDGEHRAPTTRSPDGRIGVLGSRHARRVGAGEGARAARRTARVDRRVRSGEVSVGLRGRDACSTTWPTVACRRDRGRAGGASCRRRSPSVLIRRRLRRLTLGLQPEELARSCRTRRPCSTASAKASSRLGPDGRVTRVQRPAPRRCSASRDAGRAARSPTSACPPPLARARAAPATAPRPRRLVLDGRVALRRRAHRCRATGATSAGVVIVRDRTDVEALSRRLDAVGAMTNALRVQRHEFANRLHVVVGRSSPRASTTQAERYLGGRAGPAARSSTPCEHADRLTEPYLQAFLGAKAIEAAERGVLLPSAPRRSCGSRGRRRRT